MSQVVRVLLVDDDDDDRMLIRSKLRKSDSFTPEISEASNLDEAMRVLVEKAIDVCLLDYRLGPEDGLELIRRRGETSFDGPVVVLTGMNNRETDLLAMEVGAADFLVKGVFDEHLLERTIRYALSQHALAESQRLQMAARSAEKAMDSILATVAHELRNPLGTLSLATSLLEESQHPAGPAVARSVAKMHALVDDLVDSFQASRGDLKVALEPLDLAAAVREDLPDLEARVEAAGLAFSSDVPRVPVPIMGDRDRIGQILSNLVGNAIKFTSEGSVGVRLDLEETHATLVVTDTGSGIAADFLPHIFKRFQQATGEGRRGGGLGIGLFLVHSLARGHGGTARATSDGPGTGSTFSVRLPLAV